MRSQEEEDLHSQEEEEVLSCRPLLSSTLVVFLSSSSSFFRLSTRLSSSFVSLLAPSSLRRGAYAVVSSKGVSLLIELINDYYFIDCVEEIEKRNVVVENVVENRRHCLQLQFPTTFIGYEPLLQKCSSRKP